MLATDKSMTFTYDSTLDTKIVTFYVNANYAPSELEDTMYRIYQDDIKAVCDFGFKFFFFQEDDE